MHIKDSVRIAFVGDIFPGELPYTVNFGIRSQFEKHKGAPWISKVRAIVGENDLVIGNLESPLVLKKDTQKSIFYGHPDFGLFLKECGINVLNIANNHIMEQGDLGFKSTIQTLDNYGLSTVGYMTDFVPKTIYKEIRKLKIAISGFSNVDLDVIKETNHFAVLREENVLATLKQMESENAELKILCFHWGNEYVNIPSLDQKKMAYKFIEAGADIIIGHHPHVIQPYEQYKKGHIFYSLGNFIFDFNHSKMVSIGLVVNLEISKNKQISVDLSGVKLSYRDTVSKLPDDYFIRYYEKVSENYYELNNLSDEEYESYYKLLHFRNRRWQRLLMKLSVLTEFFKIGWNAKWQLIRNLLGYYLKFAARIIRK